MSALFTLLRRVRAWCRSRAMGAEFDAELESHLQLHIDDNLRAGMTPEEARRQARVRFGSIESAREQRRDHLRVPVASTLLDIARDALRGLRAARGTTYLAIGMFAIAVAAGVVTYSVVDAILLRPLPFADPGRLVAIGLLNDAGTLAGDASTQDYVAWKDRVPALDAMGAYRRTIGAALDVDGARRPLAIARVTSGFLALLGARPALGGLFQPTHDLPGTDDVILLSDALWRSAFHADASIVGRRLTIAGGTRTVVGVLAPGIAYPVDQDTPTDAYIPAVIADEERTEPASRVSYDMQVVGRLRPGATIAQVQGQIDALNEGRPRSVPGRRTHLVLPLADQLVGRARTWLLLVLAAVGCVLLAACANVANLLLTRATVRRRELATREVLGATRARVVATLLGEGLLIATAAGVGGVTLATLLLGAVKGVLPDGLVRASTIGIDERVLIMSVVIVYVCGLAFAAAPAWLASRTDLFAATRFSSTRPRRRGRHRGPHALLVAETAFVTTLLVAATTLVTSFVLFTTADLGYDRHDLAVFSVQKSFAATPPDARAAAAGTFRADLLRVVEAIPGVTGAALIRTGVPMSGRSTSYPASIPGPRPTRLSATGRVVSPQYFAVMGVPLERGRTLATSDGLGAPGVAVVSDVFAARYFEALDPIGQTIQLRGARTIVGVVRGVHMFGPDRTPEPEVYLPIDQDVAADDDVFDLVVRSPLPVATLGPAVHAAVRAPLADGEIFEPRRIDDMFRRLSADRRFSAGLMTAFGLVALTIGVVGIYGTMAFEVAQERRAIGIRLALGATPARLRGRVLGRALTRAGLGAVVGLGGAWMMSTMFTTLVFGVTPTSPWVYAGVAMLICVAAGAGALGPAVRASRLDPLVALRAE